MKYIIIGLIVVIALVAWWLSKRNADAATHVELPADSHVGHEAPPRDRGVGGSGFYSGGGNTWARWAAPAGDVVSAAADSR